MAGQVPAEGRGAPPVSLPHHDHGTPDPGPFTPDFKQHILSTLQEWHLPGLAIAVIDGENTWLEVPPLPPPLPPTRTQLTPNPPRASATPTSPPRPP